MTSFWQVAVEVPLDGFLTYLAPAGDPAWLRRGVAVRVPLGKRTVKGVLLGTILPERKPEYQIKEILGPDEEYPVLPETFLKWLEWMSQYYLHPIGLVMGLAYPPLKKKVKANGRSSCKPSPVLAQGSATAPTLTFEQKKVIEAISSRNGFSTHLVFGVTGSGKTEVYMHLLEKVLSDGKRGLVLVPEISLTPQLIQRFAARFGDEVAVLHSHLTERERTNQWWNIVDGKKKILVGARSALFCPMENLGMIIVDEEHEPSFKQEEKLKYHGRDSAVMLGKFFDIPVVLGSATPSLESWKNALDGKYTLHELASRVEGRSLPHISVVDLRETNKTKDPSLALPFWMSSELYRGIQANFLKKKQTALFLNRRGVAPVALCPECGFVHECPNCDVTLTLHGSSHLVCHYCDYHENFKEICPQCKQGSITPLGLGTELLERDISHLFPQARVARADRDEINSRSDLEELIAKMESSEIDILIGTQMIAKGLDFINLHLVCLVLADIGFNLPDFRSPERSFQLMTQVSGRSGRHIPLGEEPGRVIIQTYNSNYPSLLYAVKNDYVGFASQELEHRRDLLYPPFGRLASLRIQGADLTNVQSASNKIANMAFRLKKKFQAYEQIEILGPAQAPLGRVRRKFRYHLLLKGPNVKSLNKLCRHLLNSEEKYPVGVRVTADVDPLNLL